MLVVDRVELDALEQVAQVGRLHLKDAVLGEQRGDRQHGCVDVGDVGDHVATHHEARGPLRLTHANGQPRLEELVQRAHPVRLRDARNVRRGLHAERPHPERLEPLEQRSVVAPELHREIARPEPEAPRGVRGQPVEVARDRRGVAGHVDVVAEDLLGRHRVRELHQRAVLAEADLQREPRLRARQVPLAQEAVRERGRAEVEERPQVRDPAGPADHHALA